MNEAKKRTVAETLAEDGDGAIAIVPGGVRRDERLGPYVHHAIRIGEHHIGGVDYYPDREAHWRAAIYCGIAHFVRGRGATGAEAIHDAFGRIMRVGDQLAVAASHLNEEGESHEQ